MAERDEFGAFLLGFLVGGLSGAIAALLLAPQSGEETRTIIKDQAIVLKDKTTQSVDEAYARAEKATAEARARLEELSEQAKEQATTLQSRGKVVIDEQKTRIGEAIKKVKPAETAEDTPSEA